MALTQASGTQAVTGTVSNLFAAQTTLKYYATMIFFDLLQAADAIEVIIYVKDIAGASEEIFDSFIVSGVQTKPATYIPPLPTDSYRISVRKTAGSDRNVTWVRSESI